MSKRTLKQEKCIWKGNILSAHSNVFYFILDHFSGTCRREENAVYGGYRTGPFLLCQNF